MRRIASTNAWKPVGLIALAAFAAVSTVVSAQQPAPQRTRAPATDGRLNVIAFGAHPDDCDLRAGGTAIKLASSVIACGSYRSRMETPVIRPKVGVHSPRGGGRST